MQKRTTVPILLCLLSFLLLHPSQTQETTSTTTTSPAAAPQQPPPSLIIYQKSINDASNNHLGTILIRSTDEPVDVVTAFCQKHSLSQTHRDILLDDACANVLCRRRRALLYSTQVSVPSSSKGGDDDDDDIESTFELWEGVEPVDAADVFVKEHGLSVGYRNAILEEVCRVQVCKRVRPVVWKKEINLGGQLLTAEILEGDEPADTLFHLLQPYGVPYPDRRKIMSLVISDDVPRTRDVALVFSQSINIANATASSSSSISSTKKHAGTITFYDDGSEPIDTLFEFMTERNLTDYEESLRNSVLPRVCVFVSCTRDVPASWRGSVSLSNDGHNASLAILQDEEPVDAIDLFLQSHYGSSYYTREETMAQRQSLLATACAAIAATENGRNCTRTVPAVYRKNINDEYGRFVGTMEILEGDEVVDAVVRFLHSIPPSVTLDDVQLKNYFFSKVCTAVPRVKCTRNVAIVFDKFMNREDGSPIGQLTITEHDEPSDVIYNWAFEHGLGSGSGGKGYLYGIIDLVCADDMVVCQRRSPLVFGPQRINDPDGEYVGSLEVMLGQEPVDALYGFFAKYGLLDEGKRDNWDFGAVYRQICALPGLVGKCVRHQAVKFWDANYTMGRGNDTVALGQFVIWDDEEVIDKLYKLRREHDLTLTDQMEALSEICSKEEVYCSRTRARVYQMTGINYNDYGRYGNETCKRQYAGWQYLLSFSETRFGTKVTEFIRKEEVKEAIESPLIGPILLYTVLLVLTILFTLTKKNTLVQSLHPAQKSIIYLLTISVTSYIYARIIEPMDDIDTAMHAHEGALPNLDIFEGEEPVDAVLSWAKEASRKHHPIVREYIYREILAKVCEELTCARRRAWEKIDMGFMTVNNVKHDIVYYNPAVDTTAGGNDKCHLHTTLPGETTGSDNDDTDDSNGTDDSDDTDDSNDGCRHLKHTATEICARIHPPVPNCAPDIAKHMHTQLISHEKNRLDSKNAYTKLGLEMDVPFDELHSHTARLLRHSYQMNFVPYASVDNGTALPYYRWEEEALKGFATRDAFYKVRDVESREFNDKPCEPVFGGALCAKTDKDGNMIIEC